MAQKAVEKAIEEITSFLEKNYEDMKFTVKFSGEFFIAGANKKPEIKDIKNLPFSVGSLKTEGNKIFLNASDAWAQKSIKEIESSECASGNLRISSQAARLRKQLEFNLAGGEWNEGKYAFAKSLLYLLHTRSRSIRLNIVKNCETEYNKMQRQSQIPEELIKAYINALCSISHNI